MRFLAGNAQHIGARHSQQDSFGFADPEDREFIEHGGFLAIVCDGMGGMEYGDAASRTAVRAFLEAYRRKTPAESIPDALERSVHEANDHVLKLASSLGLVEGIGTTLIAATLHRDGVYFVSVGDSGIFHVDQSGMRMVNRPHVFANILDAAVERGAMSSEDAANHPERESLTSYIGASTLAEIDRNVDPFPMDGNTGIVLASDGLFKTLAPVEMRECCSGPPESWAERLVERTVEKQREYQDNVTVLSLAMESSDTLNPGPEAHRVEETTAQLPKTVRMSPALPPGAPAWTPPVQPAPPPAALKKSGLLIPLIVLSLLILGAAAWWYYSQHRSGLRPASGEGGAVRAPHRDPLPPLVSDPKDVQPPPRKDAR